MSLNDKDKRIAYSITAHLQSQVEGGKLSEEQVEGVSVAIQCLCEAYAVELEQKEKFGISQTLEELFPDIPVLSDEDQAKAEALKQKGNIQLKLNKIEESIDLYSQAIDIDPNNSTFYCNRAAAYIKVENYQKALVDCKKAVEIDPKYARAHGRLGYIHSVQGQFAESKECFLKAIQLDPANDSYKGNLDAVQDQLKAPAQQGGARPQGGAEGMGIPGLGGMLGGGGMAGLFQNPGFMNMATSMMQNPAFQNMAGRMMQQGGPTPESMAEMMPEMVHTARQMQQDNPDLFDNLRDTTSQLSSQGDPPPPPPDDDSPPSKE